MEIITISGLDGSGKSTQVNLIKDYLETREKRVFYFHAINFGMAKKITNLKKYCLICRILGKCQVKNVDSEKSVTKANKIQLMLRKIFLPIDLWRFKKLIAKLEKEGYDYLISDRYFYDSVVNIDYLSDSSILRLRLNKILVPDIAIYLQTSPEIIMQRERKPDQGLEYLKKKKEIYDKYAGIWNLKIIDGDRSKEEIFEELKKCLPDTLLAIG